MVAARLANMPNGGNREEQHSANLHSASEAASKLNVSERIVKTAKKVQREAIPEVVEKVEAGELSVSGAAAIVELSRGRIFRVRQSSLTR